MPDSGPGEEVDSTVSALELGSDFDDPLDGFADDEIEVSGFESSGSDTLAQAKVRRAVRTLGEDGITTGEIMEATDLSRHKVKKHLQQLRKLREVYRQKRDKQTHFYYPNGKPLQSFGRKRVEQKDTILDIQLAKGKDDDLYFHLTEKRYSLMEGETTEGAVLFPLNAVDEVFHKLQEFADEVEQ